jgi:hypothetical protein
MSVSKDLSRDNLLFCGVETDGCGAWTYSLRDITVLWVILVY